MQFAPRFDWPNGSRSFTESKKTCYALRDHIAILSNGTIIPCCLDADGNIPLGNIFTDELNTVLKSERATKIKKGFEQHKVIEPFCKSCGFIIE